MILIASAFNLLDFKIRSLLKDLAIFYISQFFRIQTYAIKNHNNYYQKQWLKPIETCFT